MADTKIEWTDKVWNCVVGCTKVSQGCKHCYAKTLHDQRHQAFKDYGGVFPANGKPIPAQYAEPFETVQLMPERLEDPLHWRKPQRVFVNSVSDLFHPNVPFDFIDEVMAVMAITYKHTYQVLTKRPERMLEYMSAPDLFERVESWVSRVYEHDAWVWQPSISGWPLKNLWLGTSVENQEAADKRIPHLLQTPAAVRFLSCEPLLGPVDLQAFWLSVKLDAEYPFPKLPTEHRSRLIDLLDWVIVGGESGKGARPMHADWARSLRDQCEQASIPFFFKQWGAHTVFYDRDLEDPDWRRCSEVEKGTPRGQWLNADGGSGFHGERVLRMNPVSKGVAGRLLDGVEHNAFPEVLR